MPTDVNNEWWKCLPFIDMHSLVHSLLQQCSSQQPQGGEVLLGYDAKAQTVNGEMRGKPTFNTNFYFYSLSMSSRGKITRRLTNIEAYKGHKCESGQIQTGSSECHIISRLIQLKCLIQFS